MTRLDRNPIIDNRGRIQANVQALVGFDEPILVHDSFDEPPLQWNITGTGADFVGQRSADAAYFGSFGLRLQTKATVPAALDYVNMERDYAISNRNVLKISILFKIVNPLAQVASVAMSITHQVSPVVGSPGIRYVPTTGELQYLSNLGVWTAFATGKSLCSDHWHRMTISTNLFSGVYGSIVVDGSHYDLSTIPVPIAVSIGVPDYFNAALNVIAAGANQVTVDIDNIIIKYNTEEGYV